MKKLYMLALLLFASFALVACGGDNTEETQLQEAYNSLMIYDTQLGQIRGSFNVPLEGRHGVEVSWEIPEDSQPYLELGDVFEPTEEGDLREQRVVVTRPEAEEDHEDIMLIATLTFGDLTMTKEFDGRVMAEVPRDIFESFEDLYTQASIGDDVIVKGVVVARVGSGYFVTDGTHVLSVFRGGSHNIGDELEIAGEYARWNTLYQISDPDNVEVLSTGNEVNLEPTPLTFDELYDEEAFDVTDPRVHGALYEMEGIVVRGDLAGSGYTNYYLQDVEDGSRFFLFTHYSRTEAIGHIGDYEDEYIRITVRLYAKHARDGFMMFFDEANVEIEVLELDEEALLDADIFGLEDQTYMTNEDFVLPSEGQRGSVITNWSSSDTSVINDDGEIVALPSGYAEITFTGDIAFGEHEKTVEITVLVVGTDTISVDDALNTADGEYAHVEGVITGFNYHAPGFFIQDADGTGIYVRVFAGEEWMLDELEVGNKITIFGEIDRYYSHGNNQKQISGMKLLTSNDEGDHELNIETDMSFEDIINGYVAFDEETDPLTQPGGITNSVIYTVEGSFTIDLIDFGDANFDVGLDMNIIFDLDNLEWFEIDPDTISEGDVVTSITFITERIHFGNYRVVVIDIEFE